MPKRAQTKQHRRTCYYLVIVSLIVVVGAGSYIVYNKYIHGGTLISHGVIHQLPPKPVPNNGNKQPAASSEINQGTATDNHGTVSTPVSSPSNQWAVSQSGVITVKEPTQGSTIKSGAALVGTATVNQVQYTLIDNQVGVISQGNVSVVDGTFSASMNFHAYANSGRLDVYSTDSNGKQNNEVEIPVDF
jgi:hypothetical protein